MKKAILTTKVGMTQIFNEDGVLVPVTVLQAGPCVVTQVKTITVNDDTIITIDGEDATLDELQVGDTVSFFLDGETVTSLSVGMPEPTQPMQAPEQN